MPPDDLETLTREDVIALCEQTERGKEWARLGRLSVDMLAKYGHADWYSWSLANWGTKWNIEPSSAERSDGRLYLSFDTAWSPPIPVLDKLMEEFPELHFEMEYLDEGMGFAGVYSNDGCEDREAEEMAAAFGRELETEEDY